MKRLTSHQCNQHLWRIPILRPTISAMHRNLQTLAFEHEQSTPNHFRMFLRGRRLLRHPTRLAESYTNEIPSPLLIQPFFEPSGNNNFSGQDGRRLTRIIAIHARIHNHYLLVVGAANLVSAQQLERSTQHLAKSSLALRDGVFHHFASRLLGFSHTTVFACFRANDGHVIAGDFIEHALHAATHRPSDLIAHGREFVLDVSGRILEHGDVSLSHVCIHVFFHTSI